MKNKAWFRGWDWGKRNGYVLTRDLRIIAMAYEAGFKRAKRDGRRQSLGEW